MSLKSRAARYFSPLTLLGLLSTFHLSIGATPDPKMPDGTASSTALEIHWLDVQGIDQPVLPDQTAVLVRYKLDGKEVNATVPVEADTYLWKNADRPVGNDTKLVLRDNRFSEVLMRLSVSSIPKNAEIESASLRFTVQSTEQKGQLGALSCYRILTPWNEEEATWVKPRSGDPSWNGLNSGKDFEANPFATVSQQPLDTLQKGGKVTVQIPNFEQALRQWQSGAWQNNGFLLTFNGKAIQIALLSREASGHRRSFSVGGPNNSKVVFVPNMDLLDRVLLKPDDLLSASPSISIAAAKGNGKSAAALKLYDSDESGTTEGKLLGSLPLDAIQSGSSCALPDISTKLRAWMASHKTNPKLVLAMETTGGAALPELGISGVNPALDLNIRAYPSTNLFGDPAIRPQPNVYATVTNGHITYGGKRLRLWGVVGHPSVDRLLKMGFNAERIWAPGHAICYTEESAAKGEFVTYTKGDGSKFDVTDKHFADLKSHGLFVMFAALTDTIPPAFLLQDNSFIAGGSDWAQWKEAMKDAKGSAPYYYVFVDERLQEIRKRHAKNLLTHVNPYTGKAYGEEESFVIYEIFNEDGFANKILGGDLAKWPPYFKSKLTRKWNEWLKKRYSGDDAVRKAWGSLKDGESLANQTIQPAPDFEARTAYPEKRGADFVEFITVLEDQFTQGFRSYCRSLFPKGVGVNVAPFSFDTFYRPNLPWAYTQSLGDVFSQGMYFWNLDSTLDKPPSAYVIDSFTPANMPTVLYETNASRPNPYRTEYPLKLAALASRQDWDGIFWHYWSGVKGDNDIDFLPGIMGLPNQYHYWTAVDHPLDPVMCTAMAAAGRIFLGQRIAPAENPEIFKVGKAALFSYTGFRGINVAAATFSKGSRILYAPKEDSGITVDGKPMPVTGRIEKAVASGQYVTWDWPNSRLIIDAPTVKAYVGKVDGFFRFSDGITLGNVSTPWICFSMVSKDGKPLTGADPSKSIYLSGVFDAKNTGLNFDFKVQGGPMDQAKAVRNTGREPVQVTDVGYKVWFPKQASGVLKSYDFALREMKSTELADSNQVTQSGKTPFMNVLEIKEWGKDADLPVAQATKIATQGYDSIATSTNSAQGAQTAELSGATFPLAGVGWDLPYEAAHKTVRESPLVFTTISKEDLSSAPEKTISLTDAQLPLLWNSLADIVMTFRQEKLQKVEVTFKQPPPVDELLAQFTKTLGAPSQKRIEAQTGATEIHWPAGRLTPDVFVTESQGIMKLLYQAPGTKTP